MKLAATVRQWAYPAAFRIAPPIWSEDLLQAFEQLSRSLATPPRPSGDAPTRAGFSEQFLADLSTGVWRLQQKMRPAGSDELPNNMRRATRHLDAVCDVLNQAGVEITDHAHTPYVPGMSLKVIAFQPTAGIRREQVLETIKPTIYFQGQSIQIGEVIVATPIEVEVDATVQEFTEQETN